MTERSPAASSSQPLLRRFLGSPLALTFVPIAVSALVWTVPEAWYGRHWSASWAVFRPFDWLMYALVLAYLMIMVATGTALGRLAQPKPATAPSGLGAPFPVWYALISLAAFIGTASVYMSFVSAFGVGFIIDAVTRGTANVLKEYLYSDYQIGLASLRYVSSLSGGVAIYLIVFRRGYFLLSAANIVVLLLSALVSMRLSLITALLVFLVLYARFDERIGKLKIALLGVLVLTLLVFANQSRNSNFYRDIGLAGPLQAAAAEAATYVASPTQGALATVRAVATQSPIATPGISPELTTNSALLEVFTEVGSFGVAYLGITLLVFSCIYFLVFRSGDFALVAGAGAWGYAFAEVWRVHLFYRGIFIVYVAFGLVLPLALRATYRIVRDTRVARLRRTRPGSVTGPAEGMAHRVG